MVDEDTYSPGYKTIRVRCRHLPSVPTYNLIYLLYCIGSLDMKKACLQPLRLQHDLAARLGCNSREAVLGDWVKKDKHGSDNVGRSGCFSRAILV